MQAVPEGKTAHCPFRADDIAASGADFALLGHYHGSRLSPEGGPLFGYPGSPEALDFSEEGAHSVLRVEVSGSGVSAELLEFGRVRYVTRKVDVTGMTSSEELRATIAGLASGGMMRVVFSGQLQTDVEFEAGGLYNSCAELFDYLEIVDRTEPAYDLEQLSEESTTKGMFVRRMRARISSLSGPERAIAEQALILGLRAFDRKELAV
jgi:DNA repair exonuclease SbcCD nuclease subunit